MDDKFFNSHWALRITSLILALALFFYVQSLASDNRETKSSVQTDVIENVPLEAYYDEKNLIVTGLPKTVDVKIEGPAQFVMQAKLLKDYKVFVDLSSLLIGEHSVTVQTENFSEKLKVTVEPETLNINIEELVTQEFKVEPQLNRNQIAEDSILDSVLVSPEKVVISGAKSLIDSIAYVKANVKVDNYIRESFSKQSNVVVLNKDLNKLDVSIEPKSVEVSVKVKPYTREIPLVLDVNENENEELEDLKLLQDTVVVAGPKSVLDALTEVEAKIDLNTITESGEYEVTLVLPDGVIKTTTDPVKLQATVSTKNEEDGQSEGTDAE